MGVTLAFAALIVLACLIRGGRGFAKASRDASAALQRAEQHFRRAAEE